jgi:hypothetical protein
MLKVSRSLGFLLVLLATDLMGTTQPGDATLAPAAGQGALNLTQRP